MDIYKLILWTHIVAGFVALLMGLVTMATQKGSARHITTGRIYFYAMFAVFLTSTLMFAFKPQKLLFLFLIGIFSFYNTLSGVRLLYYKNSQVKSRRLEWVICSFVFCSGLTMVALGCYQLILQNTDQAILYLVFGVISALMAGSDLSFLAQQDKGENQPGAQLIKHVSRMGGSYIATFTAFVVVNNFLLPPLVAWLAPGLIGGIIISKVIKQLNKNQKVQL